VKTLRPTRAKSFPECRLFSASWQKARVAFTGSAGACSRPLLRTARYVSAVLVVGISLKQAKKTQRPGLLASSFRHERIAQAIPHTYGLVALANTAKWRLLATSAKGNGGEV
jgi:hypothetical protein